MSSDYLCNLVIPGVPKSGTSSLYFLLGSHPKICMSDPKEPQFFSYHLLRRKGAAEHNSYFKTQNADIRYYAEASQCYFAHSHSIDHIKQALDQPKIMILMRDPVERAISHYRWKTAQGKETLPFIEAMEHRGEDVGSTYDPLIKKYREHGGYTAFSRYSRFAPLWQEAFGEENVLFIQSERLKQAQDAVLQEIFTFLGVEALPPAAPMRTNETKHIIPTKKLWLLGKLTSMVPSALKGHLYKKVGGQIKEALKSPPTPHPTAEERALLEQMLAADIAWYQAQFGSQKQPLQKAV